MDRPLSLLDAAGVLPHVPVGPAEGAAGVAPQVGGVDGPAGRLRRQVHQGVVGGGGLGGQGVHGDAPQAAVQQGPAHRQVVHQIPPGGVHQNGPGLYTLQKGLVHHAPGLVVHRAVEGQDITGGEQFLQGQIGHPQLRLHLRGPAVEGVVVQLASEGFQPPGGRLTDIPQAHQTHGLLPQLRAVGGHHCLLHLHLAALPHRAVAGDPVAQGHEHEHHRVLGHRVGVAPLVVAHVDAPLPGRLQVDAVEGHPLGLDQLQVGQQVQNLPVHIYNRIVKQHLGVRVVRRRLAGRTAQGAEYQLRPQLPGKLRHVGVIAGLGAKYEDLHGTTPS